MPFKFNKLVKYAVDKFIFDEMICYSIVYVDITIGGGWDGRLHVATVYCSYVYMKLFCLFHINNYIIVANS